MPSLFDRRPASHRFLCALLAALMAAEPSASIAQESIDVPKQIDAEVEVPTPKTAVAGDKTLLAAGAAQAKPLDVAYAIPNACVIITLRPAQILNSAVAEMYPTEVIQAAGMKELGLDPLAAEQVVITVAPPLGGLPSYSILARFNQPIELKPGKHTEHTIPARFKGTSYFQSQELMLPSFFPIDDASLLAAPDFALPHLLGGDAAPPVSALAAAMAAADQGDDLLAMIDVATLRPLIHMGLAQAQIPPELASLRQIPNLVKLVEFRFNISGPKVSELIVTANNAADAEQLVSLFAEVKQLLATKMAAEAQKALASEDPVEQATGRYSQRMARLIDDRMQLTREGDRLIILRSDLTGQGGNPLVATATIGVLVGLLLPAIQAAREAARRNSSMNNIKQIVIAMLNYESAMKSFPAHANVDAAGKPLLSWRVHILPYLEQQALYERFHLDEPWNSEHNKQLIPLMPEVFLDPSSGLPPTEGKTHYLGVKGDGYVFDGTDKGRKLPKITDGSSNTIAIVQTGDAGTVPWTKPDDWQPDENNLMKPFDPLHPGGFLAGFCDGHIAFVSDEIDPTVFEALLTVDGEEVIDPNAY